jgi:hypothetical protein
MNSEFDYPIKVGDRVKHYRDSDCVGVVTHIDMNLPHPTTCNVIWEGDDKEDIQWTNKLISI